MCRWSSTLPHSIRAAVMPPAAPGTAHSRKRDDETGQQQGHEEDLVDAAPAIHVQAVRDTAGLTVAPRGETYGFLPGGRRSCRRAVHQARPHAGPAPARLEGHPVCMGDD
ncbi:MAG: hypothetical protein ACRYG8_53950 [Janthinobacterium lividum]